MTRNWISIAMLLACMVGLGCAPEPLDLAQEDVTEEGAALANEAPIESASQSLMSDDAPGPAGCKADCMDVCNQDGQHFAACSSSCQKACHGTAGPISGGGGGQNQICLAGNKVWEGLCKSTGVLQAACLFSGGCSGCRKKMDKNC